MIKKSLENINDFLLKAYSIKLKNKLDNGILNIDEFVEQLTTFIYSLGASAQIGKYNYKFLSIKNIEEIFKNILNSQELNKDNIKKMKMC